MKTSSVTYLIILTLLLVTVTIFAALDFAFGVVFYLTVVGQVALVFVVVKVLKDNYTTNKTFGDFYEDFPIEKEDRLHKILFL